MDGFCNQNADQLGSLARLSFPADVDVSVVECAPASPYTYSSSTGQPSPHKPRLVVSHSTCPPLSSSPHAYSFVLGTAVINNNNNPHGKFHLAGVTPKSKVIQAGVPRPSSTWLTAFRAFQMPSNPCSEVQRPRKLVSRVRADQDGSWQRSPLRLHI